ncbi:DNA damage-inducible protein Din7p [Trichomonascus vanleenenianus]|uniref:exonuclease 1 family protein n=1 Tax=Trichomonascus vanleenenianus TaxID=2268995 RepID=UPI003ECB49BE
MGVKGLLKEFKSIERQAHISSYSGLMVAVDGYSWLHRGSAACPDLIALGKSTTLHIDFVMRRIQLLLDNGVTPYMVFDGGYLPMKEKTETARRKSRQEAKKRALDVLGTDYRKARGYLQQAVDITPEMACTVIAALKRYNLPYVVAPYEADAQMVYLEKTGIVDAIMSEDSDMLVFGAKRLLTKMDSSGCLIEINRDDFPKVPGISIAKLTDHERRLAVILAGCDYSDGIARIGVCKATQYAKKHRTIDGVMRALRMEGKYEIPADFVEVYRHADIAFQFQQVWCPNKEEVVLLNDRDSVDDIRHIIGELDCAELAGKVARGEINPISKQEINQQQLLVPRITLVIGTPHRASSRRCATIAVTPRSGGQSAMSDFFKPQVVSRSPSTPVPLRRNLSLSTPPPSTAVRGSTKRDLDTFEQGASNDAPPSESRFFPKKKTRQVLPTRDSYLDDEEPADNKENLDPLPKYPATPVPVRVRTTPATAGSLPCFRAGALDQFKFSP